jgi:hypothetical protein
VKLIETPYRRLEATVTIPVEYEGQATFYFFTREMWGSIAATHGWLGGASATLVIPDFSGVSGWSDLWTPKPGAKVTWDFWAVGQPSGSSCSEGASSRHAWVRGRI